MEGVMMRGRTSAAVAIRKPDQSIYLYEEALNPRLYQNRLFHLPFVRGLLLLWEMLVLGTRLMTMSANLASFCHSCLLPGAALHRQLIPEPYRCWLAEPGDRGRGTFIITPWLSLLDWPHSRYSARLRLPWR